MSQNGKGDSRRPMQITQEEFDNNYERIFGKKKKKKDKDNEKKSDNND